jgi:benzoate-CoA ligase
LTKKNCGDIDYPNHESRRKGMKSFLTFEAPEYFNQGVFLVDRHLEEGRGEKVAIFYLDQKITYRELFENTNKVGNVLRELGVASEDRVILGVWDSPELFYSYLGAMKIGAVPIPINTLGSSKDLLFFLNDSRAKVLILSSDLYEKYAEIKDQAKYLRHLVVVGEEVPSGALDFYRLMERASWELEPEETSRDDMAFWMYTSGTTGLPKGVVHLHHDVIYYWPPVCETVFEIKEDDVIFCTSKVFFSYGRNASLETTLLYGCSVVLWPKWPRVEEIFEVVKKYRPTLFFSVPSFYNAMLQEIEKGKEADFSSVRAFVTAGEMMPKNIVEKWWNKFRTRIINGVGSTDVGGMYIANKDLQHKPEASGVLLPRFEAKLLDEEGKEVPVGEVGELWLKNEGITPFYWRRHQKNKEIFHGEWFKTGDLFYRDSEGYFYYQGRADDMLKFSGQWVAPMEVENALLEHPAVLECAVVAVPFEDGLLKGKAFVVLKEGYEGSPELERELIEFVKGKIAHFKAPKAVEFVKELPRTPTGKIMRYRLRSL